MHEDDCRVNENTILRGQYTIFLNYILIRAFSVQDKFSVDSYLSDETQRIPLKNLLEELKVYRSDLQNLMTDILRTETESIVHLAESLTQLTTKIRNLFVPISQFKEEIKVNLT